MQLFFELIRVAIGNQESLSHTPSADEWGELYAMAKKHSLVGVCFAGVQKLIVNQSSSTVNLSESIRLQWMGMAAKIQQRNEKVNRQCVVLGEILKVNGFRYSILKGQGVGALYGDLSMLRQSGDIDVWVDGGMEKALEWCREKYGKVEFDYINAHVPCYKDTEVELHWRAQAMTNLVANRKLQEWFKSPKVQDSIVGGMTVLANGRVIVVPTAEFNAFYILLHCYHHMFESGLGLRQLMDYYFVLRTQISYERLVISDDLLRLLEEFKMMRFAKGVMWIIGHVFKMERECMLCEPDEKEGRFLLEEVMQNGNFGHHDERIRKVGSGKMSELWRNVQHNWHLASHYPSEFLLQPIWLIYHFVWKRNLKLKYR